MNDADIEMAQLQEVADHSSALARNGLCTHGWYKAPVGEPATCLHCGKVFLNAADLWDERSELLA